MSTPQDDRQYIREEFDIAIRFAQQEFLEHPPQIGECIACTTESGLIEITDLYGVHLHGQTLNGVAVIIERKDCYRPHIAMRFAANELCANVAAEIDLSNVLK